MKRLLIISACFIAIEASAQWGVRVLLPMWEMTTGRTDWCFGGGVDHDMGPRNGIGLDYSARLDLFGGSSDGQTFDQGGLSGYYHLTRSSSGLTLRSIYFLSNENEGSYIGPFIGYRSVEMKLSSEVYDPNSFSGYITTSKHATSTLIPLGLRFGFRGELDGFFGDYYFGLGTNLGELSGLNTDILIPKDQLKALYLQFGLSYGIGWD